VTEYKLKEIRMKCSKNGYTFVPSYTILRQTKEEGSERELTFVGFFIPQLKVSSPHP